MKKMNVKIIGAGSIGNHYSNALLSRGHNVSVYDIAKKSLDRMKSNIYPSRYGKWNKKINLIYSEQDEENYNLVLIGTPPEFHLSECIKYLKKKK